MKLNLSMGC